MCVASPKGAHAVRNSAAFTTAATSAAADLSSGPHSARQSVGLGAEAVAAFLKSGDDIKAAVDCCVLLNQVPRRLDSGIPIRRVTKTMQEIATAQKHSLITRTKQTSSSFQSTRVQTEFSSPHFFELIPPSCRLVLLRAHTNRLVFAVGLGRRARRGAQLSAGVAKSSRKPAMHSNALKIPDDSQRRPRLCVSFCHSIQILPRPRRRSRVC